MGGERRSERLEVEIWMQHLQARELVTDGGQLLEICRKGEHVWRGTQASLSNEEMGTTLVQDENRPKIR